MREVKVNRADLLEIVRQNRDKHIAAYGESVEGYKTAALKAIDAGLAKLRTQIEELKTGEKVYLQAVQFNLAVPENHEKDYDQVIKMLEMSVDNQLTIRADEFSLYVMDDWTWKAKFSETASTYTGKKY